MGILKFYKHELTSYVLPIFGFWYCGSCEKWHSKKVKKINFYRCDKVDREAL